MGSKFVTVDGNTAATHIGYAFSDVATIYPITPSSTMGEMADEWSAKGLKNLFGQQLRVVEMQSEGGASAGCHGASSGGAFSVTFTASQGLLLMIPTMHKLSGELSPMVIHVSARTVATQALSIFGDHSDVMGCRNTGFGQLAAGSVQEVHDLAIAAHVIAMRTKIPFLHFFDGFRTSNEIQKVQFLDYEDLATIMPWDDVKNFRQRAMNPDHPHLRGTAQNPDHFFQAREAPNRYYDAAPGIIEEVLADVSKLVGREYHMFDYVGAPDAEKVIIMMGSGAEVTHEAADYLNSQGDKVGLIKVRLYRPWSTKHLLDVLPKSAKKVAVLDRTKEPGGLGEPLYMDIATAFHESGLTPTLVGGRYGLSSKDYTPAMAKAVYENLDADKPRHGFTVGINDDVTHLSLDVGDDLPSEPEGTVSCLFWGLGADGTVGANKAAIKIIGDETDKYAQGHFVYDSKKSGGITISHLRFGDKPIQSSYLVTSADYVACHNASYVGVYDILADLKKGGTFVLNCEWSDEELESELPGSWKRALAANGGNFYTIDALKIAQEVGLGGRINMIMQTVFFVTSGVLPKDDAIRYLKEQIVKVYGHKGDKIVNMNHDGVDGGVNGFHKVEIPEAWKNAPLEAAVKRDEPAFVSDVMRPILLQKGDSVPVSAFAGPLDGSYQVGGPDGSFPVGTTKYEKRGIAVDVPTWNPDNCIQCLQCSLVCPHATIRGKLVTDDEIAKGPDTVQAVAALGGKGIKGEYKFALQVYCQDCTGCGICEDVCPGKKVKQDDGTKVQHKALVMKRLTDVEEAEAPKLAWFETLPYRDDLVKITSIKGTQFRQPLFEFHGACTGCGETPYYKLATQICGDRMVIGNATGCSSIYGGTCPSTPFPKNQVGRGPAWANSLFEDNAEYGFGMHLAYLQRREWMALQVEAALESGGFSDELRQGFEAWGEVMMDGPASLAAGDKLVTLLEKEAAGNGKLTEILENKDLLSKKSVWAVGGDGWAYDIGYGGLDHVLAMNQDINILVLDTELYSNTGGQSSKATPTGMVAKFAYSGKKTKKKDLGLIAMTYGYVYVASVAMGASYNQTVKAFNEAEAYPGPSLLIAYSPCINHGPIAGMGKTMSEMKLAVDTGYWPMYRFDPRLREQGKNPFQLDSKPPTRPLSDFLDAEVRYRTLKGTFPEEAARLQANLTSECQAKLKMYGKLAEGEGIL